MLIQTYTHIYELSIGFLILWMNFCIVNLPWRLISTLNLLKFTWSKRNDPHLHVWSHFIIFHFQQNHMFLCHVIFMLHIWSFHINSNQNYFSLYFSYIPKKNMVSFLWTPSHQHHFIFIFLYYHFSLIKHKI
jgi:hypothetical protein